MNDACPQEAWKCLCGSCETVDVEKRTGKGENKPGGHARIIKVHPDGFYDVKYILGGRETRVALHFIKCVKPLTSRRSQPRQQAAESSSRRNAAAKPALRKRAPPANSASQPDAGKENGAAAAAVLPPQPKRARPAPLGSSSPAVQEASAAENAPVTQITHPEGAVKPAAAPKRAVSSAVTAVTDVQQRWLAKPRPAAKTAEMPRLPKEAARQSSFSWAPESFGAKKASASAPVAAGATPSAGEAAARQPLLAPAGTWSVPAATPESKTVAPAVPPVDVARYMCFRQQVLSYRNLQQYEESIPMALVREHVVAPKAGSSEPFTSEEYDTFLKDMKRDNLTMVVNGDICFV